MYNIGMLKDWLELRKYPIIVPGKSIILLRINYLWLAIRYPRKDHKSKSSTLVDSQGIVWNNFNRWLRFQVRYIHQKKWARSPIIRAVTLVNLSNFEQSDLAKIPSEMLAIIEDAVNRYLDVFEGVEALEFRNWFIRNYLLCDAFSGWGTNPIKDSGTYLEIGPGLGGALSLAVLGNPQRIYSYDTAQMQDIFSVLKEPFSPESTRVTLIPVNITATFDLLRNEEIIENVIAFWSYTELKHEDREKYFELLKKAKRIHIACNENFEGISNFDYLEKLAGELNMNIRYKGLNEIFNTVLPGYQQKHRVYLLYK